MSIDYCQVIETVIIIGDGNTIIRVDAFQNLDFFLHYHFERIHENTTTREKDQKRPIIRINMQVHVVVTF